MAITPQQLLDFANECGDGEGEVNHRNAAARAYYACYHEVLSILEHMPEVKRSAHQALSDYLVSEDAKAESLDIRDRKALSYMLVSMKAVRVTCDYYMDRPFNSGDAKQSLLTAKKLFVKCADLRAQKSKLAQASK